MHFGYCFLLLLFCSISATVATKIVVNHGDSWEIVQTEKLQLQSSAQFHYPSTTTSNSTCFICENGTYSNNETSGNCTKGCPNGFCREGVSCSTCSRGTYSNTSGSTICTQCEKGYVSRVTGSASCTICLLGFYSNTMNTDCVPCSPGSHSPINGSSECSPCSTGHYSGAGKSWCSLCPKGTFNPDLGKSVCQNCGERYYGPLLGQTGRSACIICPPGNYCPSASTSEPLMCPKDNFCQEGSSVPTPCFFLYEADAGRESCQQSDNFWIAIGGVAGGVMLVITAIVILRYAILINKSLAPRKNMEPVEIDRLIPKSDGPVYKGL